jgi:hypothetical protein
MPKAVGLGKMKAIDGVEKREEEENEKEEHEEQEEDEEESTADDHKPSRRNLLLAKLEPLPPLLQNFDGCSRY